jgi:hypothetical protein
MIFLDHNNDNNNDRGHRDVATFLTLGSAFAKISHGQNGTAGRGERGQSRSWSEHWVKNRERSEGRYQGAHDYSILAVLIGPEVEKRKKRKRGMVNDA